MKYKYLQIEDITLAYQEKNEACKKIIFFIHGNSTSSTMWLKQFNDSKFDGFRLVAFDMPSHGKSSSPSNAVEDYSNIFHYQARVLSKVVAALSRSDRYILVGYSIGTCVLAETLNMEIDPIGMVMLGTGIFGNDYPMVNIYKPAADTRIFFKDEVSEAEITEWLTNEAPLVTNNEDRQTIIDTFLMVKPPFRSSLMRTIFEGRHNDEIGFVTNFKHPLLVIFGAEEQICNQDYLDGAPLNFWNNTIYKIPSASHFVNIEQPVEVNLLIVEYAEERFSGF